MKHSASRNVFTVAVAVCAVVVVAVYFLADPAHNGLFPKCVVYQLTGYKCPGCGSQRMLHALLHGDVAGAWRQNAMLLSSLPLLAVIVFAQVRQRTYPRLYEAVTSPITVTVIVILFIVWAVIRNIYGW